MNKGIIFSTDALWGILIIGIAISFASTYYHGSAITAEVESGIHKQVATGATIGLYKKLGAEKVDLNSTTPTGKNSFECLPVMRFQWKQEPFEDWIGSPTPTTQSRDYNIAYCRGY